MGVIGGKIIIFCPAFGIEAIGYGNRFQKRRFSASVLTYKKRDRVFKFQPVKTADRLNASQIAGGIDLIPVDCDFPDKLIVHNLSLFSLWFKFPKKLMLFLSFDLQFIKPVFELQDIPLIGFFQCILIILSIINILSIDFLF